MILLPATFAYTAFFMIWAAITDARRMIIPNWISIAVILAFGARWALMPESVQPTADIVFFVVTFFVGWLLFEIGMFGGGDCKLITALSLWFGAAWAIDFLLLTAVIGGALSLFFILFRNNPFVMNACAAVIPALNRSKGRKLAIPYGLAITAGGLVTLYFQATDLGVI